MSSQPQQAWASEVLARLEGIAPDATVIDVGCGTGRVTEALLAIVPRGRVLAVDASQAMVALARARLGDRAQVWCQDVLDLEPNNVTALEIMGSAFFLMEQKDKAVAVWRRVLELDPNNRSVREFLQSINP